MTIREMTRLSILPQFRFRLSSIQPWMTRQRRSWIGASFIAGSIVLLRWGGALQGGELATLDLGFQLRPTTAKDPRILVVGIDEEDLRAIARWPIPDRVLAEALWKLQGRSPRAIGLNLFRDLPVEPGSEQLQRAFENIPNLIGVESLPDGENSSVDPPNGLGDRVGFNNVLVDPDGKVRRNLLFWRNHGKTHESFAIYLAQIYLHGEGIEAKRHPSDPKAIRWGRTVLHPFIPDNRIYRADDRGGYQVLANFYPPDRFTIVSLSDVLEDRVPADWISNRVVAIGFTARSIKDLFQLPHNGSPLHRYPVELYGVELQANFIAQLLAAALDGRSPTLSILPNWVEGLAIWAIAGLGTTLASRHRSFGRSLRYFGVVQAAIALICYLAFLYSWWLPLFPLTLSWLSSTCLTIGYRLHREIELKKTKDFLDKILLSIPDPIFVKDRQHRWIILNPAFAELIGYPLEQLIDRRDRDFLPFHEAEQFWQQDERVFLTGNAYETEETLTDSCNIVHWISTKRSLHRDPGGNYLLVGIIREITERKRREDELKLTADRLAVFNEELKQSVYCDPLTGLPNRKRFYDCLSQALDLAAMHNQIVALMFLDLDGFKQVNDGHGHDIGDRLLQGVAARLKGCLRTQDTVSRLGGDEFTVIIPAIHHPKNVAQVATKIIAAVGESFAIENCDIQVGVSIGISLYPFHGEVVDELVKTADMAMYRAKQSGKNCYCFYSLQFDV
ncbi:MAG: diguanylate cyclase [Cyanobacteria bacterium J007]|nr:MAG: diguanylate cyclase [Cyanobacteria bacterium J007]